MDNKKTYIGSTGAESFLICDNSFKDIDAPFFSWLADEGFEFAGRKGHYDVCDWAYVNITHKIYGFGMPGVQFGNAIGNKAITIEDFKVIYQIYKRYEGKELFACRKEQGPHWIYVKPSSKDKRLELIDYLEFKGFKCREDNKTDKQSTIESPYPLIADITHKNYGHLHDATCAAAAKSKLLSVEEFYAMYKGPDIEWEEYVAAIREHLKRYLTEEEVNEYLVQPETVDMLNDHFDRYIKRLGDGYSPASTANCLWMLY